MTAQLTYAYCYGLVASAASAAIARYQRKGQIDQRDVRVVQSAEELLTNALWCRDILEPEGKRIEADADSVRALGSALSAVAACSTLQKINDLGSLVNLLDRMRTAVHALGNLEEGGEPDGRDLDVAKRYFDCLAGEMVAEVSRPEPEATFFR